MSGIGAMFYCTPEGGSGYIPSSQVPTLSTFGVWQDAPVYDQTTAWLRDQAPGSFTDYPILDGPMPSAVEATCGGMGDLFLRRSDVVAPLPSMVESSLTAGCGAVLPTCPNDVTSWISANPILTAALAVAGAWFLFELKR
jgi:hypothetical protein